MYDIEELFLFRGISKEDRQSIIRTLTDVVSFERGDTIYDESHFKRALGVFLSGRGCAGDRKATKAAFAEGDVFGAAALFGADTFYVSRITAGTACRVLFIPEDMLRAIMETYPVCAVNYVTFLSERIRYLNRKIAQYTDSNAAARLYRLLCERADAEGRIENVNMSLLAGLTGMGRTSVYRAVSELEENGSIIRKDKCIYIRR